MHEQLRRLFQAAKCSTSPVVTMNSIHEEVSQEMKQRQRQQFYCDTREGNRIILIRIPVPVIRLAHGRTENRRSLPEHVYYCTQSIHINASTMKMNSLFLYVLDDMLYIGLCI